MRSKRTKRKKAKSENPLKARPAAQHRRLWIFRLAAAVLAPVLFFSLLEAGLRLAGYGFPAGFYIGPDSNGTYQTNLQYGRRFFPPELVRTPIPCFVSKKPAGTLRLFILGGSAAQGIPNPEFSFGRILEALLRHRYPGIGFEVINAAMTAINSHVVLEIAADCASQEPDLFVVYMGNNEVVGPYGPGTVFQKWVPDLRLIRANLLLKSMRTGQLLENAIRPLISEKGRTAWRGMEMFLGNPVGADDPRLVAVYRNYKQNLKDICSAGRQAGAAVILSTVAVNIGDCPPFQSLHRSAMRDDELRKWETIYQAGVELEAKEVWSEALKKYKAAVRLDGRFAELQFRMGRCLAAAGRHREARECFVAARDLDALRFRADTIINKTIREVAASLESNGVRLADAERLLPPQEDARADADGELFFEHVHLSFNGNYLLARHVLARAEAALPQLAAFRSPGPVLSREQCAEALALTDLDNYEMAEQMAQFMSRPPFLNQLDHAARLASARERIEQLKEIASEPSALRKARGITERALEKAPDDWILRRKLGKLALWEGRFDTAADHLRTALRKHPWEPMLHVDLGYAEQMVGRNTEAINHYREAIKMDPGCVRAYTNLGAVLAGLGRMEEAIDCFRKALEIDPNDGSAYLNLGGILAGSGRIEEAVPYLRKAAAMTPPNAMAYYSLGKALAAGGRSNEAADNFRRALEIRPDFADARRELQSLKSGLRTDPPMPLP